MTRPRFHLATILLAMLIFGAFVGLNLLGRPRVTVHFGISILPITTPPNPRGNVLLYPYRQPRFAVGWPAEITAFPTIHTSSDFIFLNDPTAAEWQELTHLSQNANTSQDWDSVEFQSLAPNLTKRYFGDTPFEFRIPGYDIRRPQFLKLNEIHHRIWNTTHIALNAAVALAITLALAAACELLLRRKKPAPRP